jgi:hypothetical protein
MVPGAGIEPASQWDTILSRARIPVPPSGQYQNELFKSMKCERAGESEGERNRSRINFLSKIFLDPGSRFRLLTEHSTSFDFRREQSSLLALSPCPCFARLRPEGESNPRVAVLQTAALPLRHQAL